MKIWHQSMANLDTSSIYARAIAQRTASICEAGTEVVVMGLPSKDYITSEAAIQDGSAAPDQMSTNDLLGSPYIYHVWLRQVIDRAREAEKAGYDAFVIASFSEPFLRQVRSAVDIPVVSVGESNFLIGCSYGKFQAHIANVPAVARLVSEHVHEYRLDSRVIGTYSLGTEYDEVYLQSMWKSPGAIIDRFTAIAKQAITEGADVLIPCEGVLSELLRLNEVTRIQKAPVFDSFGTAWKYAELLVNIRTKMNVQVGREWEYRRPSPASEARALKNHGVTA